MGELIDKLNASEANADASKTSSLAQAAIFFRAASQQVNEMIAAAREPGMPLDRVSRWTQQMPLQALAVAFLIGVMTVRRRAR
ncbi:hypothetical protein [Afipia sp. GAS231]|uniref:hypothetical protein n=1 Tax=Afipia sp. GAS231 TaxID=1882747 RepID=UPI00087C50E9|nr:hypothetical protein [Afipia sp. GAS231]SDO20310.1 hypothetical protein SAMN05444050_3515 [Afipia sp. GAS231]